MHVPLPAILFAIAASATLGLRAAEPDAKGVEFFEKEVRPVLVARCYKCHAQDAEKLRGGLLLDSRQGWTTGGDSGPAIVPGDPDASLIIQAIRYDGDVQMPPDGKLAEKDIAALVEWVKLGAPDPRDGKQGKEAKPARKAIDIEAGRKHWAFQPLVAAAPPDVADAWCRTPVDRFIIAQLGAAKIAPNPAADPRRLVRRAYLDLLGLPPTPDEVEAFVADASPDAWERLVDRLLASPHYGERWARHWLDLARFAESHGFEHDYDRPTAYHYRDFVIKALNQDLPYDTFVRWQIAGDEYEPETPLALAATGYLAAGVHSTQITKNQVEKERYDELDDITATIGTSLLGLTIGCARCHDHKYDPIPTNDYYRLLSTFTTAVRSEIELNLDRANYEAAVAVHERDHAPLVQTLAQYEAEQLPAKFDAWLASRTGPPPAATWQILDVAEAKSDAGATLARLDDGSFLATSKNAESDAYTFTCRTHQTGITAVRLEALAHESLPKHGPGRADNGNFALSDIRVTAAPLAGGEAVPVKIAAARATFEQKKLPVAAAFDDDPKSAWAVDGQVGKDHAAVFEFASPVGFESGTALSITLKFATNAGHAIGRPRLAISTAAPPAPLDGDAAPQNAAEIEAIVARAAGQPKAEDRPALVAWYRPLDPGWRELDAKVRDDARAAPQPTLTKVLITSEGLPAVRLHTQGDDFLKDTHFLERGDPNRKKDVATQGFLQVLMTAPDAEKIWQTPPPDGWRTSYRRRALAEWVTDTKCGAGHLLARVIVNRLWQHHLGRGIVATPSDFGTQGDRPTHPELLDYLAGELVREGWRLKPIHRLIMASAVYREGSPTDEARAKIDPDNKLLWRHVPKRLESEAIRDSMLAAAGMLDETMFGPGTLDEASKRRSIYFTVKRSKLLPMMVLFDAPDALQGIGQRSTTTIAPQALLLLNNKLVREAARGCAARVAGASEASPSDSVRQAYALLFSRPPTDDELSDGCAFLDEQTRLYATEPHAESRQQALADFCQALLSLNEFVYVE
ncbi:MAG: PSD1 domain-containing protein [Planctomycetia bacterium]|nr:PSD1 domain-containing protein [Planctomycetia bacterium]